MPKSFADPNRMWLREAKKVTVAVVVGRGPLSTARTPNQLGGSSGEALPGDGEPHEDLAEMFLSRRAP